MLNVALLSAIEIRQHHTHTNHTKQTILRAMGALSQADDEEIKEQRRKSARLSNRRQNHNNSSTNDIKSDEIRIHDSGTESDEEEMESIHRQQLAHLEHLSTWASYDQFLSGGSPPALSATPPIPRDVDTESFSSWDSFGRESGIMTGDNDSDTDGAATPTPLRRRIPRGADDDASSIGGEKRRHSMTMNDHPIAWRLRSFTTEPVRPVKIAARRAPVFVLINRPPAPQPQMDFINADVEITSPELIPAPAPKRNRRNSHRPSLDFEKMVENRIDVAESNC
ncbi:unnamed protein product [Caenorhabditis angaria]|uniref:Uncharacterized protein n=1 Tax=Caenorhabditis angaria TaxID=860376 RepID=A0A9P1N7X3_9PELO|nr:unnamed protein product [Caenorhabditis angaria]